MRSFIEKFYLLIFGDDASNHPDQDINVSIPFKGKVFTFIITAIITSFILLLVCIDISGRFQSL